MDHKQVGAFILLCWYTPRPVL